MSTLCTKCGAEFYSDAPQEFCSACLLETGLFAHEPVVAGADRGGTEADKTSASAAAHPLQKVTNFGDYELLEKLGSGGQGLVYRARQKSLNRIVALKVIGLGQLATTEHLKRFRLEAQAAAKLDHPCIVPIYEVGERDGSCYFSMKFIDGGQLDEVARRKPMSPRNAAELIAKLGRAVHYAHEHGILHRDIKPGNILIDTDGEPHLTDFGLARLLEGESTLTRTMDVLGTPSYMSPEQAVGNNAAVSSVTDVYGLGAVLYQLLTGQPPFAGGTTYDTIKLVLDTEPRQPRLLNPKIDRDVSTICLECLEKDPKRRYPSALALAEDLEHWLKHEPIRARRSGIFTRGKKWVRRNPSIAVMAAMLLALAAPLGVMIWKNKSEPSLASNLTAPEKSIAVLPFENRSEDEANAYFADGVQDEILTRLSKIADLKVISRTSIQHYKSAPKNLPEIGRQLDVAHILEGSVQKIGDAVRVNVQLIKAANDSHLWADTFDRKLTDTFSVESEVAKAIADQLQVKLTRRGEQVIAAKPTDNPAAYDAYLRGRAFAGGARFDKSNVERTIQSYQEAVKLDPNFALAWAYLSCSQSLSYWQGEDPSPAQAAAAKDAADRALALDPDIPETHLALGYYRYYCQHDFTGGLTEFQQAEKGLPNNVDIIFAIALIQRRLGHWEESIGAFRRAIELDPRNTGLYGGLATTYLGLRRFPEALATADRVLAWEPANRYALGDKVRVFWQTGDLQAVEALLANPNTEPLVWGRVAVPARGVQALFQQRYAMAIEILSSAVAAKTKRGEPSDDEKLLLALSQQRAGDAAAARATYQRAVQDIQRELAKVAPSSYVAARMHAVLGVAYAGLSEAASAIAEGQKAMAMQPTSKDQVEGPAREEAMARIYALLGDGDHAIPILKRLLQIPSFLLATTPAVLRLDPVWDQIRNDPRFQKLVEEAKQPVPMETSPPEKSIAVLPFENRSRDPDNAYFADGVQDEILTRLSKIADLKVISRTSTQHYKSAPENLPEIGRQLGVAHILEGSVQKIGDAVRVNVQLIKAANDSHLWADTFDRKLTDTFSVESEVAKAIAEQLQVKLTGHQEQVIAAKPTDSPQAYDAYLLGRALAGGSPWDKSNVERTIQSYQEAVKLDPNFAVAWAYLSCAQSEYYWLSDPSPAQLAPARDAADRALALDPNLPETHLALGYYRFYGQRDYKGALAEFQQAERGFPNNADIIYAIGLIQRRLGHWEESIGALRRAIELDPRNTRLYVALVITYRSLRRFPEALATIDRARAVEGRMQSPPGGKASVFWSTGDLQAVERLLASPSTEPLFATFGIYPSVPVRGVQALVQRRYTEAIEIFSNAVAAKTKRGEPSDYEKVLLALSQQRAGDVAAARATYQSAAQDIQRDLEKVLPDSYPAALIHAKLGLAYAGLGQAASAIAEGQKAMAIQPTSKDAFEGPLREEAMARIYALLGDADHAIPILKRLLQMPYGGVPLTPALLRLDPVWDQIRNHPRFQELVEESKQPIALK